MKKLFSVLFLLGVFAGILWMGCSQEQPVSPDAAREATIADGALAKATAGERFFVLFQDRANPAAVERAGGKVVYSYRIVPAVAATGPAEVVSALADHPGVVRIEPDGRVQAIDDELDNTWGVKRIGAGIVHSDGNKGAGIEVGILDSGIDYTHPDLDENYKGGYDFVNDDDNPMDDNGHGTHVSGTVAAEDNDEGVVGVAPEADLYGLKVLDSGGGGSWSDVVAALDWASDPDGDGETTDHLQITNNSYGAGSDPGSTVKSAFDNSAEIGILHVAAAGNSGNPPGMGDNVGYPARYESVIAVAATDQNDERAGFSSTGPDVELAAPGVDINSTKLEGGYVEYSGTSMASPHVAGTAALVLEAGYSDVRTRLQNTADDLGPAGRDSKYGYGLVDADEAAASQEPVTDIAISAVEAPSSVVVGDTVSVDVTVENVGNQEVSSDINVTLTDDTDGVTIGTQTISGGLAAGASVTLTYSWDTGSASTGDHTLTATHDFTDDDASNDSKSTTVTVNEESAGNDTDMYVWAIDFAQKDYGPGGSFHDLFTTVTIHQDSDGDGVAESDDNPVADATVAMTLRYDSDGDGLFDDGSWDFSGTTDSNGQVEFTLKRASTGTYQAEVTDVTHSTYNWNSSLDADNPDTYTLQ